MTAARGRALALAGCAALSIAAAAEGQETLALRSTATPRTAKLGEVVHYRGRVTGGPPGRYRWMPPERGGAFTWGRPEAVLRTVRGRVERPAAGGVFTRAGGFADTLYVDAPVQVFALGDVSIPGLRLEVHDGRRGRVVRLPAVAVTLSPTLDPADTSATLDPVRTIAAPWWERVPWAWIAAGLALLALLVYAWRRLRRRRPLAAAAPAAARLDPTAEALEALARLRALGLAERARFAEHAFLLGQILRRYLEATVITARPGDTTPELIAHLREARLEAGDLQRLAGLLRVWDRVKFAREPQTVAEAARTESAVEAFLRRPQAQPVTARVA